MKTIHRLIIMISLLGVALLAACGPKPTPEPSATTIPTDVPTDAPTATDVPTEAPEPTPTRTPRPSATPRPTEEPTATASGSGGTSASATPGGGSNPTATPVPPTAQATGQATSAPPSATTASGGGTVWVPSGQSRWQLSNDPIASGNSAACAGPIDVDYYGLAIVQNNGGAINWIRPSGQAALGQDPANPNLFVGPMASVYAGYDLTVAVVFLGPQNLSVTHFMKEQGNPDCRHFFEYSAFRLN